MIVPRRRIALVVAASLILPIFATQATAAPGPSPWVGLGGGHVGDYLWSVKTRHLGGAVGSETDGTVRPCIFVGTTWQIGPFNYRRSKARRCANSLSPSEAPLVASGAQPSTGAAVKLTAVGMISASAVRQVRVTFSGDRTTTIALHRLPPARAREAGLGRLRYAAFAVRGTWCVERLTTLDAGGRTLWDSGVDGYSCTGGAPPPPAG